MKRAATILLFLGAIALISGGCAPKATSIHELETYGGAFSLASIGPAIEPEAAPSRNFFHLGAGDSLGQAVFMNYAALVRANPNWHFADGRMKDFAY